MLSTSERDIFGKPKDIPGPGEYEIAKDLIRPSHNVLLSDIQLQLIYCMNENILYCVIIMMMMMFDRYFYHSDIDGKGISRICYFVYFYVLFKNFNLINVLHPRKQKMFSVKSNGR